MITSQFEGREVTQVRLNQSGDVIVYFTDGSSLIVKNPTPGTDPLEVRDVHFVGRTIDWTP